MEEFGGRLNESQEAATKQADNDLCVFRICLDGYQESRVLWAKAQETTADDFNLFEVMDVVGDENLHSNILAWLLARRIEHGTHAQGNLGFRLFLETLAGELKLPGPIDSYAETNYWVRREVAGGQSRMDVEVAARGSFIIHIENKIWSAEGMKQTSREWEDLLRRRDELGVPEENVRGLFLTPDRRNPSDANFIPISWGQIAGVLDKFEEKAKPPVVKLFAAHYARALRAFVITEPEEMEEDNDEQTV
jgi:hypothetical protein